MSKHVKEKYYLTVISIVGGVITLIEPDGKIGYYRQRGMNRVDERLMMELVSRGAINYKWKLFKELPKNYSISYEDPDIMGRAVATFNPKNYM